MTVDTEPEALLSHLQNADGSATFSYAGYTVVGAVNGPIEVQRRDEIPEEAAVDVIVRPAAGVGGLISQPRIFYICEHSRLTVVCRHERKTSGVANSVDYTPDHSCRKLSTNPYSNHFTGHGHSGKRICKRQSRPGQFGELAPLRSCGKTEYTNRTRHILEPGYTTCLATNGRTISSFSCPSTDGNVDFDCLGYRSRWSIKEDHFKSFSTRDRGLAIVPRLLLHLTRRIDLGGKRRELHDEGMGRRLCCCPASMLPGDRRRRW